MYEFIIHTQVPAARHNQVLNILAGIGQMQPEHFTENDLIYRQLKLENAKRKHTQPEQPQRLRYHKLRRDSSTSQTFTLVVEETPDAGVKDVNARKVFERPLHPDELLRFRSASDWYRFESQYVAIGSRFVRGNVVVRVYRVFGFLTEPSNSDPIDAETPSRDHLQLLDKSGAYVVEAYVRAVDEASQELRETAKAELLKIAKILENAIDLRPVSRLALDTTVKGS